VDAAVIDGLHPGGEQPVQVQQIGHVVAADHVGFSGDLDQELVPYCPE
jgi:hypothetical protein